jgi:hypothetical protein
MVNLLTQQLSPVPRTNALLQRGIHRRSPRVPSRRLFRPLPISLQSHRRWLINTWSGNLVPVVHNRSKNSQQQTQLNRHHLNQVDSTKDLHPTHTAHVSGGTIASTPPALQSLAKSIPTKPQLRQ